MLGAMVLEVKLDSAVCSDVANLGLIHMLVRLFLVDIVGNIHIVHGASNGAVKQDGVR